jgi:hypothetical protein
MTDNKKPNYAFYSFLLVLVTAIILSTAAIFYYLDTRPTSQITVNGKAQKNVKYDKVTLNFYIQKRGTVVAELNAGLDTDTKKVTDYLESTGISKDKIQTNKSSYDDYIALPNATDPNFKVQVSESRITVKIDDLQSKLYLPTKITDEVTKLGQCTRL